MKKYFVLWWILISIPFIFPQPEIGLFSLFKEFEVGLNIDQIEWKKDMLTGYSPKELSFFDGRLLWIGESHDGKLFNIQKKSIDRVIKHPYDPRGAFENGRLVAFSKNLAIVDNGVIITHSLDRNLYKISKGKYHTQTETDSGIFLLNEYSFFYDRDDFAYAIDPLGNFLDNDQVKKLLSDWFQTTFYLKEEEKSKQRILIESGKYIIINGVFYPSKARHMAEYLSAMGLNNELFSPDIVYDNTPLGYSVCGELIWWINGLVVTDREGNVIASVDDSPVALMRTDPRYKINTLESRNISNTYYAVHPNGDIYAIYAIKDEVARLYKAEKTWGPDLIGMARAGLASGGERALREKLQGYSPVELRILRNAIMAIHNYAFKGKDLTDYFLGYDWYEPDPSVKNDTAILTPDQKRLFDLVLAIEKERVLR